MDYQKTLRSFLLGLSGAAGTYLVQYLSTTDLGPTVTPLVAAFLPVAVDIVRRWWNQPTSTPPGIVQ